MAETLQKDAPTTIADLGADHENRIYQPPPDIVEQANITAYMRQKGFSTFDELYRWSVDNLEEFWADMANRLFSQSRIKGSFQIAERFATSWKAPWLAAPSPKKQSATWPLPRSLAESAAPPAMPKPPPTMPLAPSMPSEKSAMCMLPPLPRQ